MALIHRTGPDGVPRDLIGQPLVPGGPVRESGVRQVERIDGMKAPHDGVYELNGGRFLIRAGHLLPEGAVMDTVPESGDMIEVEIDLTDEEIESILALETAPEPKFPKGKRSQPAAPDNRAEPFAPENR